MFGISPPPLPVMTDAAALAVCGVCLVIGAIMVLWGRLLGRSVLCAAGIASGLALAYGLTDRVAINPFVVRMALAAGLGLACLLLARLLWAVLAGAMLATVVEAIGLFRAVHLIGEDLRPTFQPGDETLLGWTVAVGRFLSDGLVGLWQVNAYLLLGGIGLAGCVSFLVVLIRGRLGSVLMTSMVGAAACVIGPMIALGQLRDGCWNVAWMYWYIPLALMASGASVGIVLQLRSAARQDAAEREQEQADEEEEPSDKERKTRSAATKK